MKGPGWSSRYSDSIRAGRSGDRIQVGARFSAPVQTGSGTHPASCTMGTGSFPGVKRPGRGADPPPLSKRRGHERVELYLYSPSGSSWPVIGEIFLYLVKISVLNFLVCNFHSSVIFPFGSNNLITPLFSKTINLFSPLSCDPTSHAYNLQAGLNIKIYIF